MNLLLDTQIILRWLNDSPDLPSAALQAVEQPDVVAYVSKASLWEIAIKVSVGKMRADVAKIARDIPEDGFQWLEIEVPHLLMLSTLARHDDHKDPFDRLLVAQSLSEPLILLTTDAKLARYGSTIRVV